jgi:NAD(P)-dependent dehydrogenase (short-subunit alcohol dehydrogenase family)/threonine dehydrogenase-like Zn-dependent dehydrogenase
MWLWPLYGKGFENLGSAGGLIRVPVRRPGRDQLLVRIDAVGMCFSDIKIINLGPEHPRLQGRDMEREPVVLGHEVSMTAVEVGEELRDRYRPGDRFIVQADIIYQGKPMAMGYRLQGGMAQYVLIGPEILKGDDGNYLLPVRAETGYSQAALCEPWACVLASYRLKYRTSLKPGGTAWFIGNGEDEGFTVSPGTGNFDPGAHPARVLFTAVDPAFRRLLAERSNEGGFSGSVTFLDRGGLGDVTAMAAELAGQVDDLVFLGPPRPELVGTAMAALSKWGLASILADRPLSGPVSLDVGRIHYENWQVVGAASRDVAAGHRSGVRSELKAGGSAWFVGAAGPMGRMHVQRAIEMPNGPRRILATDVSSPRLEHLKKSFGSEAMARKVELITLNPSGMPPDQLQKRVLEAAGGSGFDDIVVLVPAPALIAEAFPYLGPGATMNVFAGVARGVRVSLDLWPFYGPHQVRMTGSSGSSIADLEEMLKETEAGRLSTDRAVAAVGGLASVRQGYQSVAEGRFPGKVVIYPQVDDFPLTPIDELPVRDQRLAVAMKNGGWNREAERAFLAAAKRLPDPEPAGELAGKVAVVTGGGQGLGQMIAERLVAEGAWVMVTDIDAERARASARKIEEGRRRRTLFSRADVTSEEDMDRVVQEAVGAFGKLDILVANAGILLAGELTEIPLERWRKVLEVNLTGYFVSARAAAKVMKEQKSGVIIQINSKTGKKGSFHNPAYSASKFGGIGLTQSMALDLAPYGVRVNAVCPGNLLDSPLWLDSLYEEYAKKWKITKEEVRRKYTEQVPLGRGCEYDDVANVVVFLASPKAGYLTGQAINVTGGQEMR